MAGAFDSRSAAAYSALFDTLFPICRSITGPGLHKSLEIFQRVMPLEIESVPSGTAVFDWEVPPEWRIRGARLTGPDGRTIVDFADSNLHVVSYSEPFSGRVSLDALQPHLHSIPEQPDLVPYVTAYYDRGWGFCLPHRRRESLPPGDYTVEIDSEFAAGGVPYGWCDVSGDSDRLVQLSSYLCHPSLANNELSGPLVLLGLYHRLRGWERRRHTYRFLLNPETIGSLCYLHNHHRDLAERLAGGLVLTCLGGPNATLSIKLARREDARVNRLAAHFAKHAADRWRVRPFDPTGGSDERQFCAPGFDLPIGQAARTIYGDYPQYHTSGDDKAFMDLAQIVDAVDRLEAFLLAFDESGIWVNQAPYGEPQLGKRGLYPSVNSPETWGFSDDSTMDHREILNSVLTILSYADGARDLIDIAERRGVPVQDLIPIVRRLDSAGLLARQAG